MSETGELERFQWRFLHPRYWGMWLVLFILVVLAFFPGRMIDPLLAKVGKFIGRRTRSACWRARINLQYCFPEKSEDEREAIIDSMFEIALPSVLAFVRCVVYPHKKTHVVWHNRAYLDELAEQKKNIIFFVPHCWAIDLSGIIIAKERPNVCSFIHLQKNKAVNWAWNQARAQFGAQLYRREDGIKPFIKGVKAGAWGYYLPDEDYGEKYSVFTDFFGTYKATLPSIGRIAGASQAAILPLFPEYDLKTSTLHIHLRPVIEIAKGASDEWVARRTNQEIESMLRYHPEQYIWALQFLKTRKNNAPSPYL